MEIGSAQLLARYFRVKETNATFAASDGQLVAGDPTRIVLIVAVQTGGPIFITTQNPATGSKGIAVSASMPPIMLNFKDHGGLVQLPWRVFGNGVAPCTVTEVFELPPSNYFSAPGEVAPAEY